MFEPQSVDKIVYRTMNPNSYSDELPLDYMRAYVRMASSQSIGARAMRAHKRWWKFNSYPTT